MKKLMIQTNKYNGETAVVSVRLSKDMLAEIDDVAEKTGRSKIMLLSMEFALENMEIK